MDKSNYMYSKLLDLSKSPDFQRACENEDLECLESVLLNANILKKVSISKSEDSLNGQNPQPEPRVAIAVVELVVAGYVGAIVVTVIIGKNKDTGELETANFELKSPMVKNVVALISKFGSANFVQKAVEYFQSIERATAQPIV